MKQKETLGFGEGDQPSFFTKNVVKSGFLGIGWN